MEQLARRRNDTIVTQTSGDASRLSVGERLRIAQRHAHQAWSLVCDHSQQYAQALGMTENEIRTLENFDGVVVVSTSSFGEIKLIAKNTSGASFGASWQLLLQARPMHRAVIGLGMGTGFIAALTAEEITEVLEAIKAGNTRLVTERVWP